uniref:SEA domain-containing protein n=1 Tax=Arion vulgaris TaxID=1028688 RepID=A0A0B7AV08_9EUPU
MAFLPSCRTHFVTRTIISLICVVLAIRVTESASYGEHCDLPTDCYGRGLTCSPTNTCVCAQDYMHFNNKKDCTASKASYGDELVEKDFLLSSDSTFETDMAAYDLNMERMNEIKSTLASQLTELFKNLTGFKEVVITQIQIFEKVGILMVRWTIKLNRNDPKFVNATPMEIKQIIQLELEEASKQYTSFVHVDTSKPVRSEKNSIDKLSLGLDLGLGLAGFVLFVVIVVAVILVRRKRNAKVKETKSISDQSSSCGSEKSSKMEPDNYQYTVFATHGDSAPPHYARFATPSVSGSSSAEFVETNDKLPLQQSPQKS